MRSQLLSFQIPVEREDRELHQATRPFAQQSPARSWAHVASTFGLLGCALTAAALAPWWPLRLAASILGALVLARTFILYHDFMHGSILPGSKLARAIFYTYAAVNLTPPRSWRDSHNFHHTNVGRIPTVTTLRPRAIAACFRANLWDEASRQMIDYGEAGLT